MGDRRRIAIPRGMMGVTDASPPGVLPPTGDGVVPRLPGSPAAAYSPPTPPLVVDPQPPQQGLGLDYESTNVQITLNDTGAGNPQQEVYTTRRRWRGIDVYLAVPSTLAGPLNLGGTSIGIQVYAIVQGVRTLVDSGRFDHSDVASGTKWMVSYRGIAERFDVQLTTNFLGNAGDQVQVAIVASDECIATRDGDEPGVIAQAGGQPSSDVVPYTLVAVNGVCDVAGPVWLQVYDHQGPPGAGVSPIFEFQNAGEQGGPALYDSPALQSHAFVNGFFAAFSSTVGHFTAAGGNQFVKVWFK